MDSNSQSPTMWTTGYIGNIKVSFTFPIRNEMEAYAQAKAITDKLLADGFTTTEPGLEAGEQKEPIGWIARRAKSDGTPILDLYLDNEKWVNRLVMCYLDDDKGIKAFEQATGLTLDQIPLYDGDRIERGNTDKSRKYIIRVAKPTLAIIKDNPHYNPDETDIKKKKPARLFIRWEMATQQSPVPAAAVPPAAAPAQQTLTDHQKVRAETDKIIAEITGEPPAEDYGATEKALREAALKSLDGETLTLYEVHYQPQHNGRGYPRWEAKARCVDGTTVPLVVWTEHEKLIKKAGWDWPNDAENLEILVITAMVGSERRIKSVLALDGTWMELNPENVARNNDIPAWIFDAPMLYKRLGEVARDVNYRERVNIVEKMHHEGEFDKVSNLDSAVLMVVNRLQAHRKAKAS